MTIRVLFVDKTITIFAYPFFSASFCRYSNRRFKHSSVE